MDHTIKFKRKLTEGYYLADAPTTFANSTSAFYEGVPNGWKPDNRFMKNEDFSDKNRFVHMRDTSSDTFYALNRDFAPEKEGVITAELLLDVKSTDNCVYVAMTDAEDEPLVKLSVRNGKWVLVGNNEAFSEIVVDASESARYSVILTLDLTERIASACINNTFVPTVSVGSGSVSRLKLGTQKGGTGSIRLEYVRMWKDYALNEHFAVPDTCAGQRPCGWTVAGNFSLASTASCKGSEIYSLKSSTKGGAVSSAQRRFERLNEKFSLEAYFLLPEKTDGMRLSFVNGSEEVFTFETKNGALYYGDLAVNDYIPNIWQGLCVDADSSSGEALIRVNGKLRATVRFDADAIDGIKVTFAPKKDAVLWLDDIKAYPMVEHDDYPAQPHVPKNRYNIGTNVCWLWRDFNCGEGWDSVSSFPEFEPYMGYYDEGSREYADWEIKQLAENGINFIHACWYSPNGADDTPIKNQDYSFSALHDGYFNAKYSDLVKFCIMWENARMADISGFEKWKNRVWNYWVEYYFKDERYLRLDNKAVLTVFVPRNLEITFGGPEGVRKAIAFMNDDIKKYGYDGILILSDNEHYQSYEYLNELGIDGSYAYQWGRAGDRADYQIEQNHDFAARSLAAGNHHIPTVSVGFNCVGRGFNRSGFVSAEEHLKVCRDIKDLLDEYHTGTWRDNTLIVSTWNEYSEGHLVAPTLSIGYTLLDNVRRVFTESGDEDYSLYNVRPTDRQLERITRMYPPKYAPLRQLLTESDDTDIFKDEKKCRIVRRFSMDREDDAKAWKPNDRICKVELGNGMLSCVADKADPNIICCESHLASEIDAIRVKMRCKTEPGDAIALFFATDTDPRYTGSKVLTVPICRSDEFVDYYLLTKNGDWRGNVIGFRLDPIGGVGSFEILEIDFLKSAASPMDLYIDGTRFNFPFTPIACDDDFEIAVDKMLLFKLGLYYEYDRWTSGGKLFLKDRNNMAYTFENGRDFVNVGGTDKPLGYTVKTRDGLPVVRMGSLLSVLGKTYDVKKANGHTEIYL